MSTEIKRLQPQMIRITGASQNDILTVGNGTAEFTNNLYLSGVNVGTSAALAGRKLQVVGDTELSGSIFQSGNYIDVIATGNNLETQIAGNDADIATLNTNLVSTGNALEAQIVANDGDISTLTSNLISTGNNLENQIISNDADISALDSSTVRITGDQGIAGDKIFSDNVTINNLTVTGTRTIVESTDLAIEDNVIDINSGETGAGISKGTAGFNIDRGTLSNATILFEEANDRFNLNFPVASEGDLLAKEADLIATGNNLEAQITSTVAGNLTATGNALEAQIIANDGDISTLTTNLASTGSTLQSNLDTVESAAAASLVSTGNALDAKVDALQVVDLTDTPSSITASTSDVTQVLAANAAGNGVEFVGIDKTTPLTSDVFTGDGATSSYTLSADPNGVADIMVSVNGLLQTPGDNYSVSGTTLTMSDNVPNGLALEVRHLKRYAAVVTGGGSGSSTFLGLTDSPASYTASKYLAVNSAGTALEFVDAPAGGGSAGTGSAVSSSTLLTGDGSVSGFAMGINVDAAKDIMVSVNGLVQRPDVDYSLSNNTGIVFDAAPTSGHAIEIRHFSGQAGGGGGSASISYSKDVFTGDGTVSGFTMGRSVSDILETTVFINGLAQLPDENYFVSGTDLTFASGDISSGDVIMVRHMYA